MGIMKDFIEEINKEINDEDLKIAKEVIKNRIREIQDARRILDKMEKQLEAMLDKSPEEIIHG